MAYLDQMNVKADEQDTVGTDYDIRDKNLNAATAKTSVASTDGVVLKGTDGSYHTIDRSSFTEAVRSVIGGILNNMASKGTAVKGVGVIDNANDFGLTTPSDLASVLGDPIHINGTIGSETDLNTQSLKVGAYRVNHQDSEATSIGYPLNWPAGNEDGILVIQRAYRDTDILQIVVTFDTGSIYVRTRGGSYGWRQWKQLLTT